MLPKIDGVTVCKNLRKNKNKTPIIILTAKSTVEDKIMGLDSGADDYITKPFSFNEFRSRVHALIRRSHQDPSPMLWLIKVIDLFFCAILNKLLNNMVEELKSTELLVTFPF